MSLLLLVTLGPTCTLVQWLLSKLAGSVRSAALAKALWTPLGKSSLLLRLSPTSKWTPLAHFPPTCMVISTAANHGLLLPSTVPLASSVEDLIQALDKDLADVVAASLEYRDAYFTSRTKGQPTSTTNFAEGSYVMARFPGRAPKLLKWRGPFLVLSRDGNAYNLQDLTTLSNVSLDVKFLKAFDAASHSAATLKSIADIDTGEEVIDYIVSYTGNPTKRNSLSSAFTGRTLNLPRIPIIGIVTYLLLLPWTRSSLRIPNFVPSIAKLLYCYFSP